MSFGQRLKQVRKDKGLAQQVIEDKTGFDKRQISRWEGGYTIPSVEAAAKIAAALDTSLDELCGASGDGHNKEWGRICQQCGELNDSDKQTLIKVMQKFLEASGQKGG